MLTISLSHCIPFLLVFDALICHSIYFTCFSERFGGNIFNLQYVSSCVSLVCRSGLMFSLTYSNFLFGEVKHTLHFRHEVDDRVIPLVQTFERSAK